MADEQSRLKVLQSLSEKLDPELAAALMECVPPFAWTEIATTSDLVALEERVVERFTDRLDSRLHAEITRSIKWTVGAVFGGFAAIGGAAAGIAAIVR